MFCPVDGVEYREGITRCPDHDVDLVDEPLQDDESSTWRDGGFDLVALRIAFGVVVVAGIVHAVAGGAAAILGGSRAVSGDDVTKVLVLRDVVTGAYQVLIGAFGVLGGTVLFRAYANMAARSRAVSEIVHDARDATAPAPRRGWLGTEIMRILFVLLTVFALLWVGTGFLNSGDESRYFYEVITGGVGSETGPELDRSFVTVSTLHSVSYYGGVACLAIMGGLLALTTYRRLNEPASAD